MIVDNLARNQGPWSALPTVKNLPADTPCPPPDPRPEPNPMEPPGLPKEEYDPDEADRRDVERDAPRYPRVGTLSSEEEEESYLRSGSSPSGWVLKRLKPLHKKVASLLAQGTKNVDIARLLDITPEYVYVLSRQPLMQEYIGEMCKITGLRLEAMFEKSVDVIASTLENGTESGRLKAARLQLEATRRIGRGNETGSFSPGGEDRFAILANRLLALGAAKRAPGLYPIPPGEDSTHARNEEIQDAEFRESNDLAGQESESLQGLQE